MIKLVLDTNVVVSALINDEGLEAALLDWALHRGAHLYVSESTLAEYQLVLPRPKFRLDPRRVSSALDQIRAVGILVHPSRMLSVSPHEADNRFLECAEAADADYLVTGNRRHFPKQWGKMTVVNAREFLERIALPLSPEKSGGQLR